MLPMLLLESLSTTRTECESDILFRHEALRDLMSQAHDRSHSKEDKEYDSDRRAFL